MKNHLAGVQLLRGVAAFLVVFQHYLLMALNNGYAAEGWSRTEFGKVGVDIFFVISGFIMESSVASAHSNKNPASFLTRRAIRILPLCWAMTLLAVLACALVGNGPALNVTPWRVLTSLLMLPDGIGSLSPASYVISSAWTLTYEIWFYILFAGLLAQRPNARLLGLAVIFAGVCALSLVWPPTSQIGQIVTDPLLFEFLAGCLLANLSRRRVEISSPLVSALMILAACGFLYVALNREIATPRLLVYGMPAIAVVAAVVLAKRVGVPAAAQPLAWSGDISYSLYLSHFFTMAIFQRLVVKLDLAATMPPSLIALLFFAMAVGVAAVSYSLIEQPSRRYLTQRVFYRRSDTSFAAS